MEENNSSGSSFGSFMLGFLIGGLVSAAISLLNAPQSGEATREQIAGKSVELRDRVNEEMGRIRTQAEGMLTDVRTRAGQTQEQLTKQLEDMSARMASAIDEGKKGLEAARKELVTSPSDGDAAVSKTS